MRKKRKYSDKHKYKHEKVNFVKQNWMSENADLWEILQNPWTFESNFLKLPYQRQIAMVTVLNNLIKGKNIFADAKIQNILSDYASLHMDNIHKLTCSFYEEGNAYFPISDDEKKLVRMECYGSINARLSHELSTCYKFFNDDAAENRKSKRIKYRLKDYDMSDSPMWRVFSQFESFRSIEKNVRRFLYENKYNPDAIKVMTVSDFCDIIYKMTDSQGNPPGMFLSKGYKKRFVMRFMKAAGDDLLHHMINKGIDERAAKSLCRYMRLYGICDVDSLTITETHYTPKIIEDLKANKYDVSNIKVGDCISEDFIEFLLSRNQENLIMALDENGNPIDKSGLPHYEVHHKNAVKFSAHKEYLAKSNYDENLMLVEHDMHQVYYHGSDQVVQLNGQNEKFFSRINVSEPTLCLIDGFNSETDAFFLSLANSRYMKKRREEDEKHVVNYYHMEMQRLNNVAEIAEKYNINYSKKNLSAEKGQINEFISKSINVSGADLKVFSSWMKSRQKMVGRAAKKNQGEGR